MLYYWAKGYFDSLISPDGTNKAGKDYTFGTHKRALKLKLLKEWGSGQSERPQLSC